MITIVSGLPRSGTSLMMQMLAAGGLPVLTDETRAPDEHNPRGYYEDRRVKSLGADNSWIGEADGMALKVVSLLLYDLPDTHHYRVIFMRRDLDEVLRSQHHMLSATANPGSPAESDLRDHFQKHLKSLKKWLAKQQHIDVLEVEFRNVIDDPLNTSAAIAKYLERDLVLDAMASVVDPSLYRQRHG